MEKKIEKVLSDNHLFNSGGLPGAINFASWERLRPFLAQAAGALPNEVLAIRASKEGVEIILVR